MTKVAIQSAKYDIEQLKRRVFQVNLVVKKLEASGSKKVLGAGKHYTSTIDLSKLKQNLLLQSEKIELL